MTTLDGHVQKSSEELLKQWKECLDEMAGTDYDCSFDCGSHMGEEGYCYHGKIRKEEDEKAAKVLEKLLSASTDRNWALLEAENQCGAPERQGWGRERGLAVIERFRR